MPLQGRFVGGLVESDDQRLAFADGRSAEVSGGPQHQLPQRLFVRRFLFEVKGNHLLALGHVQRIDLLQEFQRIGEPERLFFGVDLLFGLNASVRKEPLRFSTAGSARTVVTEVEFLGHRVVAPQETAFRRFGRPSD